MDAVALPAHLLVVDLDVERQRELLVLEQRLQKVRQRLEDVFPGFLARGEFAAFAESQSADRRERVYQANKANIEAAARAKNPALTSDAIKQAWLAATPLGWVEHRLAWAPNGELGRWATRLPAVALIGGTLFAHGGISAEYARLPLATINQRIAAAMAAADDSATTILYDPLGPLWYRGLAIPDADAEAARAKEPLPRLTLDQELTAVLTAYGARRMVIGHTPRMHGIEITPDGRLARIDTGITRFYGGPLTWLEIVGERMIPHTTQRTVR